MQDFPLNYAVFYRMCIHHARMHMRIVRHNENVSNYLRHQSQYICCFQIIYSRKTTYRQHAQFDSKQKKMVTRQAEYEIISQCQLQFSDIILSHLYNFLETIAYACRSKSRCKFWNMAYICLHNSHKPSLTQTIKHVCTNLGSRSSYGSKYTTCS